MYCPSCGEEIEDESAFCRYCGESVIEGSGATTSEQENTEPSGWKPTLPITSVFTSIMLLWSALNYDDVFSYFLFGVSGVLIIPRIRRKTIRWARRELDINLTETPIKPITGLVYAVLLIMATATVIGSTANDPTIGGSPIRQVTIGLLTIGIMFGIAVVVVTAVRVNRKLRSD